VNELEQRWRDLGEFIREQRRLEHLSLRKLSEMASISNPYLSQIERGLRKPSAEILQQIARALEISAETLYVRAGILEERDGEHDLVDAIRRDGGLTEDQKKTLIHIYQSFAAETRTARGEVDGGESDEGSHAADATHENGKAATPATVEQASVIEPATTVSGNGHTPHRGLESSADSHG
jgi:transcriptional regulator with XRE-family HTH domain